MWSRSSFHDGDSASLVSLASAAAAIQDGSIPPLPRRKRPRAASSFTQTVDASSIDRGGRKRAALGAGSLPSRSGLLRGPVSEDEHASTARSSYPEGPSEYMSMGALLALPGHPHAMEFMMPGHTSVDSASMHSGALSRAWDESRGAYSTSAPGSTIGSVASSKQQEHAPRPGSADADGAASVTKHVTFADVHSVRPHATPMYQAIALRSRAAAWRRADQASAIWARSRSTGLAPGGVALQPRVLAVANRYCEGVDYEAWTSACGEPGCMFHALCCPLHTQQRVSRTYFARLMSQSGFALSRMPQQMKHSTLQATLCSVQAVRSLHTSSAFARKTAAHIPFRAELWVLPALGSGPAVKPIQLALACRAWRQSQHWAAGSGDEPRVATAGYVHRVLPRVAAPALLPRALRLPAWLTGSKVAPNSRHDLTVPSSSASADWEGRSVRFDDEVSIAGLSDRPPQCASRDSSPMSNTSQASEHSVAASVDIQAGRRAPRGHAAAAQAVGSPADAVVAPPVHAVAAEHAAALRWTEAEQLALEEALRQKPQLPRESMRARCKRIAEVLPGRTSNQVVSRLQRHANRLRELGRTVPGSKTSGKPLTAKERSKCQAKCAALAKVEAHPQLRALSSWSRFSVAMDYLRRGGQALDEAAVVDDGLCK